MNRAPFPLTLTLSPGERGQPRPRLGLPSVCVLSQRVVSAERGVRSSLPMNLCVRPASAVSVPELAPQSRESRRGRGSRAEIAGLGSWLLSQRERVGVRENGNCCRFSAPSDHCHASSRLNVPSCRWTAHFFNWMRHFCHSTAHFSDWMADFSGWWAGFSGWMAGLVQWWAGFFDWWRGDLAWP
jgi:hypothetical protein